MEPPESGAGALGEHGEEGVGVRPAEHGLEHGLVPTREGELLERIVEVSELVEVEAPCDSAGHDADGRRETGTTR